MSSDSKTPQRGQKQDPESHARRQDIFIQSYSNWKNISEACRVAGIARTTYYQWMQEPAFAAKVEDAAARAVEKMEKEMWRRAREGRHEPVFYKGEIVGTVKKPSDLLMIFTMKAEKPDKYRERVEHTGANGAPLLPVSEIRISLVKPEDKQQ